MSSVVWPRGDCRPSVDTLRPDLPDDFWCACLLALLAERPGTGRDLCEGLRRRWLIEADVERLDQALRALEHIGFAWALDVGGVRGPGSIYCVTAKGAEQLDATVAGLCGTHALLGRFVARCGERFVSSTDEGCGEGSPNVAPA